ncbi:LOW QUALITY PROTEIN: hypothetical protein Cgig2_017688 [Carnegiea gigantea]|uniref:Endonuclease/exonuclease/phosphatase domain-containing protein n=1 Tax=Carnegiea gigantea TaxID=171969 RepID=A0A9Q1JG89_9CARY|nr:LOW QUALITY PROTEIN: hypothetical protein Cgig2_017688 [Carnegiea gigantea]
MPREEGQNTEPTRMVGFLETKVKEENMTHAVGKVCSNWQWEHNADSSNRGRSLDTLVNISNTLDDSWCLLGDFNSILHQGERIDGNEVSESEMADFIAYAKSGLREFSYVGAFFTWTNKTIWSRIDRALYNTLWYDTFDYTHVTYQDQGLSDHFPISLDFPTCPMHRKAFHFYNMWALKSLLCSLRRPLNMLNRSKYADIYAQQAKAGENLTQVQLQL